MAGAPIRSAGFATTTQWVRWEPLRAATQADDAAALVTSTAQARAHVAEWARDIDGRLADMGSVFQVGGWVPDPASGEVVALAVGTMAPDLEAESPSSFGAARKKARAPRGVKVFDRDVLVDIELPGGIGVVEVEQSAARRTRLVDHSIVWTVFPTGYAGAVQVHLRTAQGDLWEALADEGRIMVENLVVSAEAP
jgi:hypothetical protein